ncbi:MAG TPA: hypothetical protein PLQ32_13660 [Flavihumibacter sp.]|nr:hypothetical protein [Bacteroidota bacterium]HOA37734.1 hypothetical protein [Flavihumibacter sp.]HPZ89152.1 hypothetical protein [Flavihumibacter sp.]
MKKLITTLTVLGFLVAFMPAQSQVRVGVQVNLGAQPMWGPAGYDYAEYYYLPDIDVYYNIPRQQFVYFDRGRWCYAASLPHRFRHFDLFSGYKVVINEPNPYMRGDYYRNYYGSYRGWNNRQMVIRDAPRPGAVRPFPDRRDDRYDRRYSRHDRRDYDRRDNDRRDDRYSQPDRYDNHQRDRNDNHRPNRH